MKTLFTAVCILALNLITTPAFSADRVVVIPINGKSTTGSPEKLWGQGRPGSTTLLHDNGTLQRGSCTATSGVKFALSKHLATWEGAATVCPKDTWVCSSDEILDTPCPITITDSAQIVYCDTNSPPTIGTTSNPLGWVTNLHLSAGYYAYHRTATGGYSAHLTCLGTRVWCCQN